KALRYGIIGAFIFRFIAVLLAAKILDYWQLEVIGGIYLLQLAVRHLLTGEEEPHYDAEPTPSDEQTAPVLHDPAVPTGEAPPKRRRHRGGFWATVAGVEM